MQLRTACECKFPLKLLWICTSKWIQHLHVAGSFDGASSTDQVNAATGTGINGLWDEFVCFLKVLISDTFLQTSKQRCKFASNFVNTVPHKKYFSLTYSKAAQLYGQGISDHILAVLAEEVQDLSWYLQPDKDTLRIISKTNVK